MLDDLVEVNYELRKPWTSLGFGCLDPRRLQHNRRVQPKKD